MNLKKWLPNQNPERLESLGGYCSGRDIANWFKFGKKGGYYLRNTVFTLLYNHTLKIIDLFFTGLLLAYLHWKSQCLQLLEHVGVRIQVELWWTQNGSIQDSRWELEDASKLVGILGNDEICSQCCKFFL